LNLPKAFEESGIPLFVLSYISGICTEPCWKSGHNHLPFIIRTVQFWKLIGRRDYNSKESECGSKR
jgi:hypothetical protein